MKTLLLLSSFIHFYGLLKYTDDQALKVNIFTTLEKQTIFKNPSGSSSAFPQLYHWNLFTWFNGMASQQLNNVHEPKNTFIYNA